MAWHHAHEPYTPTERQHNAVELSHVCMCVFVYILIEKALHLKSHGKPVVESIVALIATH